jgi:competence protein ComEA
MARLVLVAVLVALGGAGARASGKAVDGVVNLNTAPPDSLMLLPGIGPAKVQSILAYRRKHPFRTVDELVRIKGIGRKMVRRLRAHLAIGGPTTAVASRGPPQPPPPPAVGPPRPPTAARPPPAVARPPPALARRGRPVPEPPPLASRRYCLRPP